jgi:signal transduction histidine kinase
MVALSIENADGEELQIRLAAISALSNSSQSAISINRTIEEEGSTNVNSESSPAIFSELMKDIRQTIHQAIDTIIPPNLALLDSLITVNLNERSIKTNLFYTEIIDLNTNTVLTSSRTTENRKRNHTFIYEYDSENRLAYKVHTAPVMRAVLSRMSGILTTTLLTILLLSCAFWYFIRTVVRQKALEEMKQDFTNNMTHELKTPISVSYAAIDTLLNFKQGEDSEKRKQYLNICIEQLSHLQELVDKILSMSMERSESSPLKKKNIPILQMFSDIAEQQAIKSDKCVDIETFVEPFDLEIYADESHLQNILGNLVDNAIKYSFESVKIKLNARQENNYCILTIKDNGIGISSENQNYIFDRFYRVPHGDLHQVKGFGLGLFYVKTIVEQHEGKISVKSEINKGSEFTIKIPVR